MKNITSLIITYRIPLLGLVALVSLTSIAYSNISAHKFLNWDDIDYILRNDRIKSLKLDNLVWMFSNFSMANWHPLTWLSYTFNYVIWTNDPVAYKVTNIVLHVFNSILIYALTFQLLAAAKKEFHNASNSLFSKLTFRHLQYASALTAILFAIHPLHVESVTWISERKDVLYSMFFLLCLIFYINHRNNNNSKRWLIASIIMFLCSLMSKPMSVTVPLLLVIIDVYPLNLLKRCSSIKNSAQLLAQNKTTYLLLSFLVSIITVLTQRTGIQGAGELGIYSRLINSCMSVIQYVYHFFWPVNLSTFYSFHPWVTDPNIYSVIPIAIVLCISVLFFYFAYSKKIYYPLACWLYFLISLLPVIGIVKVGAQAAADRYTYMPLLSLFIISSVGCVMLYHMLRPRYLRISVSTMFVVGVFYSLTYLSYEQNYFWKDDKSLWTKAISYSPGTAAIPYSNLGSMYFKQGKFREAIVELNKALAIMPNDVLTMEQLGKSYELMHRPEFTVHAYRRLIETHPDHPLGYIRLGDYYYRHKQIDYAKSMYSKAFKLAPTLPATLLRSALVDNLDRNYGLAEQKLDYALQLNPNDIGSLQLLAKIKFAMGKNDEARAVAEQLLRKSPQDSFTNELLLEINAKNL